MNIKAKTLLTATLLTALFSGQSVIASEHGLQDEYTPYTSSVEDDRVNFAIEAPVANISVEADIFPETNR